MHPITPIFSVSARTLRLLVLAAALLPTGSVLAAKHSPKKNEAPAPAPAASTALETTAEGQALRDAWVKAQYRLSPEVCTTYLAFAKAQARRDLAAAGKTLPDDFWAWVDGDPVVRSTVYGARLSPANILLMLRSLELDLGQDAVRKPR